MERVEFLEQLRKLKEYSDTKGQALEKAEVMQFFEGMELSEEQAEMIFNYVKVKKAEVPELTAEEKEWLSQYKKELDEESAENPMYRWMNLVVQIASEYVGRGLPLEDLIQEGNTGMVIALSDDESGDAEQVETEIRRAIRLALEEQEEAKASDEKMVGKVNDLIEQIKKLTEELGYKPSIDEVSHYLNMTTAEIKNLLYLAGEEIEEEEEAEEEQEEHGAHCDCGHHHEHHHHEHGEGCGCGHHHK